MSLIKITFLLKIFFLPLGKIVKQEWKGKGDKMVDLKQNV